MGRYSGYPKISSHNCSQSIPFRFAYFVQCAVVFSTWSDSRLFTLSTVCVITHLFDHSKCPCFDWTSVAWLSYWFLNVVFFYYASFINDFLVSTVQAIVLTGLQPDQTYQIRVAALTRKGDGPQSNPVLAKTKPKLPNPPHVYNMPSSSPSEVIIRWKTVARDILSFKLRYAKSLRRMRAGDQANLKMKEMTFLARTSNHIFKGLGEFYMFSLRVLSYSPFSKRYFHLSIF